MTPPFVPTDKKTQQIAHHVEELLRLIGEDSAREGLKKTIAYFDALLKTDPDFCKSK